jgi:hypothetical protein
MFFVFIFFFVNFIKKNNMKNLLSAFAVLSSSLAFSQYWTIQNTAFTTTSRGISGIVYDANTVWAFAYDGVTSSNNVQEFTKTSNGAQHGLLYKCR